MKLILPLILLLLGIGGGVGAGMLLIPPPIEPEAALGPCGELPGAETEAAHAGDGQMAADAVHGDDSPVAPAGREYARINNQFVVPLVSEGGVTALMVMALSVEVLIGSRDLVFTHEPKLRDAFLQVMFDHANIGGFDGTFTSSSNMSSLRNALRSAARDALGEQVTDVLIVEIVRQDI